MNTPPDPQGRPVRRFDHAEVVHPTHRRAGAGDFTVKPVTPAPKGVTAILTVLGAVFGGVVLVGGLGLLSYHLLFDSEEPNAAQTESIIRSQCAIAKKDIQTALLEYKAATGTDAPSLDVLVPQFLDEVPAGWDYRFRLGDYVDLTPEDACR